MKSIKYLSMVGMAMSVAGFANAAISYDFSAQPGDTGNSLGSSLTYTPSTAGGVTVTETAWWLDTGNLANHGTTNLQTAGIDAYNGAGLGVCNAYETINCAQPVHQIDNYQGMDFVLLAFSSAVDLSSLTIQNFGNGNVQPNGSNYADLDLNFWVLSSPVSTSTVFSTLGAGTAKSTTCTTSGTITSSCTNDAVTYGSLGLTSVKYLLIGAATGQTDDAFKLTGITGALSTTGNTTAAPEPASFVLIGSGLMLGAFYGRRRKLNAAKV